jgi:hypothetical protein
MVTGDKNSPTAARAGRKRRPIWVPRVWGYCWATLHRGLSIRWTDPPGLWLGDRSTTYHRKC